MSFFQSPFNPVNFALAEDKARNISSIDPKLSRTNYYDGRLLKASDLIRDQLYLDERLREAGRVIGQGIVRGLDIQLTDEGRLEPVPNRRPRVERRRERHPARPLRRRAARARAAARDRHRRARRHRAPMTPAEPSRMS